MSNELTSWTDSKAIEEAAKTVGKAFDASQKLGNFLGRVLGTVPEDVVGIAGGDWLRHARIRNCDKLARKTDEILRQRRVEETTPVSPSVAIPLFEAARDEGREELQDIWAKLLAAAMDPARTSLVRHSLIKAVKQLDPLDARVLNELSGMSGMYLPGTPAFLSNKLQVSEDEVLVSFANLEVATLVYFNGPPKVDPKIGPLGNLLLRTIRG